MHPLFRLMIQFTKDETQPNWHGYFYTALFFVSALARTLFIHQYFHRVRLTGMRIKTAVIAAVYTKVIIILLLLPRHSYQSGKLYLQSLRLSNKARKTSTVGEIVNLMSVDAHRLSDLMIHLHMVWSAPLQIVLSLVFLYLAMGPSIFAGFAVMLLMIPVNSWLASWSKKFQVKQMTEKDSRIKLINEVLNGIKVCKF